MKLKDEQCNLTHESNRFSLETHFYKFMCIGASRYKGSK